MAKSYCQQIFTAFTGHRELRPKDEIFKLLTTYLDCRVFGHFIIICIPGEANIMSALAKWQRGENSLTE